MRKTLERSGSLWLPSRREIIGALGVGLLAPRLARSATFGLQFLTTVQSGQGPLFQWTVDTTGCDLLVIMYACALGPVVSAPIDIDSKGNLALWSKVVDQHGDSYCTFIQCVPTTVGAGHNIRLNSSAAQYGAVWLAGFSGGLHPVALDVVGAGSTNTGTTISPGAIVPSMSNELVISAVSKAAVVPTYSVDASMTLLGAFQSTDGYSRTCAWGYTVQTSPASINPVWTSSSSGGNASIIASFKSSSSSGGGSAIRRRVISGGE